MKKTHSHARLMRSLGFKKLPPKYGPKCDWSHWQHFPSGAVVVIRPQQRITAAIVVRRAIAAGIEDRLRKLEQSIASPIAQMRTDNAPAFD
jgi:hypothetical protein